MSSACYEQNIVVDFEFAPVSRGRAAGALRCEIIEIGAVRLDAEGSESGTFSCFVTPRYVDRLPAYLRRLTKMRDSDVMHCEPFEVAIARFAAWVGGGKTRIVAWSKSDQRQLEAECAAKGVALPASLRAWLDLQKVYPRVMGVGAGGQLSLRRAADWCGEAVDEGRAHRALYDARVTAQLLQQLLTGEYRSHRKALDASLGTPQARKPLSASLGSRCRALAALAAQLHAAGGGVAHSVGA